jgi:hypothetical protein
MNRRHAAVIGGIAIASISTAIFLYYFFMPAWLLVERLEEDAEHVVITLSDSAIEASPKLKEALETADERYNPQRPGTNSFKLTSLEGNKILDVIREHGGPVDDNNLFRIENNGKYYLVSVLFQYEPPALA